MANDERDSEPGTTNASSAAEPARVDDGAFRAEYRRHLKGGELEFAAGVEQATPVEIDERVDRVAALSGGVLLEHAIRHGAHAHHHRMPPGMESVHWLMMVAAMMLPLQFDVLRWVAFRSYGAIRQRAVLSCVIGYLGAWALAGIPVVALRAASWTHSHWSASAVFAVAGIWAFAPSRERAARGCHFRRGLVPQGWSGVVDTASFGTQIGKSCVLTCWPLMLGCALTGHDVVAMVGGAAIAVAERFAFRYSPLRNAVGPLLLALYYAVKP